MSPSVPVGRLPISRRFVTALLSSLVVLAAGFASPAAAAEAPLRPDLDPFYTPPAGFGDAEPGTPLRTREVQVRGGSSKTMYDAIQVLYRTTDANEQPIATVATVILPKVKPAAGATPPVVSYQAAYDGLGPKCRPSYTMRQTKATFTGDITGVESMLKQGWVIVAADHEGPDDAWMAGYIAGHATLDGIRAAQRLDEVDLSDAKIALSGYSGGGHATAWANELANEYAPELDIVGAVQGGVPADLRLMWRSLNGSLFTGVMVAGVQGVARSEPHINPYRYLNPLGAAIWRSIRKGCIADFMFALPFIPAQLGMTINDIFKVPAIAAAADKNALGQRKPSVPTWMYHAHPDELVTYNGARKIAKIYCEMGATLRFTTYKTGEHVTAALQSQTQTLRYLRDRFAGLPAPNTC